MNLLIKIRTVSEANVRCNYYERANRVREQRFIAKSQVRFFVREHADLASAVASRALVGAVKLSRIGPRRLDDDNLRGSLKAIRDGVADALGVDDGDPRVTWDYEQEVGEYAVRIQFERRGGGAE